MVFLANKMLNVFQTIMNSQQVFAANLAEAKLLWRPAPTTGKHMAHICRTRKSDEVVFLSTSF